MVTYGNRLNSGGVYTLNSEGGRVRERKGQLRELPQAIRPTRCTGVVTREKPNQPVSVDRAATLVVNVRVLARPEALEATGNLRVRVHRLQGVLAVNGKDFSTRKLETKPMSSSLTTAANALTDSSLPFSAPGSAFCHTLTSSPNSAVATVNASGAI